MRPLPFLGPQWRPLEDGFNQRVKAHFLGIAQPSCDPEPRVGRLDPKKQSTTLPVSRHLEEDRVAYRPAVGCCLFDQEVVLPLGHPNLSRGQISNDGRQLLRKLVPFGAKDAALAIEPVDVVEGNALESLAKFWSAGEAMPTEQHDDIDRAKLLSERNLQRKRVEVREVPYLPAVPRRSEAMLHRH